MPGNRVVPRYVLLYVCLRPVSMSGQSESEDCIVSTKTALVSFSLASVMALAGVAHAQQPPAPSEPIVIMAGEAIILSAPDRAFLTVTAESRSRNSSDAQRQNAAIMTAVLQKVQQGGVPKEAIRTLGYDLQPDVEFVNGRQVPRGYLVRNTIEVRTDDLNRLGEIIDLAIGAGATSVGAIRFDLKNRTTIEREALKQAVEAARAKADAAAAGAGRVIDRVLRIEETGGPEIFRPQMRMATAEQVSTPIVPSTIEVHANITLTASLK